MQNLTKTYWHGLLLCLWGILSLFSSLVYAAPDIVAQNYASARSPGIQSCTVGYDLMAGDVGYGQSLINGALPYNINYRAPLRQNLSAAQVFAQPEESSLGWTDNYQAHVIVQNISFETKQYQELSWTPSPYYYGYYLTSSNPVVTDSYSAKAIRVRLPGESVDTLFKEQNGSFSRLYSADAISDLSYNGIRGLPWSSDLGEYQLSRVGNQLVITKNGIKYTVSAEAYNMAPSQTQSSSINVYINSAGGFSTTTSSWFVPPSGASSNTDTYINTRTTVSIDLYRISKVDNQQGGVIDLQYDNKMNLTQVSDRYNNKLVFEHNFHDPSTGSSQTIDESRLVTKVTYMAAQGGSQVATFNYQAYANRVPSTGNYTTVFALVSSDSTAAGAYSYVNEMTEIGAVKTFVARWGRTADSSYYYPILRQVKNSLGQIVRQWDISQNYVLNGTSYSTAQTTLRSYTPLASGTSQDFTTVYNDIAKTINLTLQLNSGTASTTVQSTVNSDSSLTIAASGYPCLTSNGQPVSSAEFSTSRSRLLKVTNGNNIATTYEYDPQNRITRIVEAVGTALSRTTSYVYGALNDNSVNLYPTPTSVSTANLTITNEVNPRGQIVTQTQTSSQAGSTSKTTRYYYEENPASLYFGRLWSVDGPRSGEADRIIYAFDGYGYLYSQSQFINGVTRTTQYLNYNIFGQPERIVSPNGMVEQFVYNGDGTLASQTTGVGGATGTITGQTTSYAYNSIKQKISETNPDGETTQFEYDEAGRLIKKTMMNGSRVEWSYYPVGTMATEFQLTATGSITTRYYQYLNAQGRVHITQQGSDTTRQRVSYSYDNNGNIIQTTTSKGVTEKWNYDALNRITSHTDGEGNVDTTGYDVNDNLSFAKDALNAGTNPYSYRNGSTLTQEVNSDYGTKTYSYNEADQLTQRLHRTRQCNYNYLDEVGRYGNFNCVPSTGSTSSGYQVNDTYSYDQSRYGRLDQVQTGLIGYDVDTVYGYDSYDRVTQKVITNQLYNRWTRQTGASLSVGYGYSLGGKPTSLTLPSGRVIQYAYNAATGLLSYMRVDNITLLRNLAYNGANRIVSWRWGASANATHVTLYKNDGTITSITNKDDSGVVNYSLAYSYDQDGQVTQINRHDGSVDTYSYDLSNRLVYEGRTGTEVYNISYGYDGNGNRTSLTARGRHKQPVSDVAYSYTNNRLTTLNKNGQVQTLAYLGTGEFGYGDYATVGYDNAGRLKVERAGVTATHYYSNYNHRNERGARALMVEGSPTNIVQYVYDEQSHLIGEYDINGVRVEYVWLGDKPVAAIYGSGANTKIYYIVSDAQNTPRRLIDSSTYQVVWAWDSTAFGLGDPVGTVTFNLRFPGQYYDAGTEHFYNHNRYYNPELGRYMEPDPIGLEGGSNPYAYAGSNPVMNVDPSGLVFQELSEKALRTSGMDMPSIPEPIYQALMGAANSVSFGIAQPFSDWANGYPTANMDSSAYKIGEYGSIVGGLGGIAVKGGRNVIRQAGVSVLDMTSPTISRTVLRETQVGLGKTPLPQGMTNPQFGELAGWGNKADGAVVKLGQGYTASEIQAIKNSGITKTMIEQWKGIYSFQNEQRLLRGSKVATPEIRAKLMQKILEKW